MRRNAKKKVEIEEPRKEKEKMRIHRAHDSTGYY